MRVKKNQDDHEAEGLEKKKSSPQHIWKWTEQSPLKKSTDSKVDGVPEANQKVGPGPDFRNIFYYSQGYFRGLGLNKN